MKIMRGITLALLTACVLVVLAGCSQAAVNDYIDILKKSPSDTIYEDLYKFARSGAAKDFDEKQRQEFFNNDDVVQATYDYVFEKAKTGAYSELKSYLGAMDTELDVDSTGNEVILQTIQDGLSAGFTYRKAEDLKTVLASMAEIESLQYSVESLGLNLNECGVGLTTQEVESLFSSDGIVLTEGMKGFYSQAKNKKKNTHYGSTKSYKEGTGSALEDAERTTSWKYYGNYAIREITTARDSLTNKPGEPVNFHYETTTTVFHNGNICYLPHDIEGARVFDDGKCVIIGDKVYVEKSGESERYVNAQLIN